MKITMEELKILISTMEDNKIKSVELDIDIDGYNGDIYGIDFDWWENEKFKKTLLTIEEKS